jgi:hypothetical protein
MSNVGGFYGSIDANGDMLNKKYSMLKAEGVVFSIDAAGKSKVESACVQG